MNASRALNPATAVMMPITTPTDCSIAMTTDALEHRHETLKPMPTLTPTLTPMQTPMQTPMIPVMHR